MKPAALYACLFVYVAVIFGMEKDYQTLQKNALTFYDQCKKMENLIADKVKKNLFAIHMYKNLLMRNWYLQKDLSEQIQQSFLKDYYMPPDQNEFIKTLCDDLISSYIKYNNEHANQENQNSQWQKLLTELNTIVVSHLFLNNN